MSMKHKTFAAVLAGVMALPAAGFADDNVTIRNHTPAPSNRSADQALDRTTTTMSTANQAFVQIDADSSGSITEGEYLAHAGRVDKASSQANQEFDFLDTNDDDTISLTELTKGAAGINWTTDSTTEIR